MKLSVNTISLSLIAATEAFVAAERRSTQNASYHYIPVDFDYGANERVTANITFGTAANTSATKVVMDTGSAGLWVSISRTSSIDHANRLQKWEAGAIANYGSVYLGEQGPCNESVPNGYNATLSYPTAITNMSSLYSYASNSKLIYGDQYANDTLSPSGGNGAIPNVQFAMSNLGVFRQGDDGTCTGLAPYDASILGLAPLAGQTVQYNGPLFRENLFASGLIASRTMVMWFNKATSQLGRNTGGVLFGAIDKSKYTGPLVRVPSTSIKFAETLNPNITFNGFTYQGSMNTTNCTLDSGTHSDTIPLADGDEIQRFFNQSAGYLTSLPGDVIAFNGTCDSIPADLTLGLTFAGEQAGESVYIDVPLRNYARGANVASDTAAGVCRLNLSYNGACFLGATFNSASFQALDDEDNSIALAQGGVSEEGSGVNATVIGAGQSFDTV